jgi:hypothetical protein
VPTWLSANVLPPLALVSPPSASVSPPLVLPLVLTTLPVMLEPASSVSVLAPPEKLIVLG